MPSTTLRGWWFLLAFLLVISPHAGESAGPPQTGDRESSPPGSVSSDNTPHKEELEDPQLEPVVPRGEGAQGPSIVQRGAFTSVQVNVNAMGGNIPNDAANEPSIAVDPTNPNRIVIGWRQFNTRSSNFRQAGWAYSHTGGQSWTFPGVIQPGVFRSDPVLGVDANGVFFYYSLTSDFLCQFFRSFDGGVTWGSELPAFGGDKAWFTIDRTGGIGTGNIYTAWSYAAACCGQSTFTRSTDGAMSFLQPFQLPQTPTFGTLAVDPDGILYIAGVNAPRFSNDTFVLARSFDARDPAATPTFPFSRNVNMGGAVLGGAGPNPGGLLGQVWIACNHSTGPNRGHVYMLSSVRPDGGEDPMDVMFIRSPNNGVNWSSPMRVNDDPAGNGAWQWFGTMSVAPNGRIDAVWNDTRNDPGGFRSEVFYSYSTDDGLTWSANVPVTPSFNPFLGYPNQNKLGDYYDMVSDDIGVHLAYAATFNGEQDVYYLRIRTNDCNGNDVDDADDIAGGTSSDCDGNLVPDECDVDCNGNGSPDACDIVDGFSEDCNGDGIPDECQLVGRDCDGNQLLDSCEIAADPDLDCQPDGILDACQLAGNDCNGNLLPDDCDSADLATTFVDPEDVSVCPGESAVFSASAPGASAYRWRRNGVALQDGPGISGATTDTLVIDAVDFPDGGEYACDITVGCITARTESATLTVLESVFIATQPLASTTRCAGKTAAFSVAVQGSEPEYAWRKDGALLSNGGRISGANSATLYVADISTADEGGYSCVVSNRCSEETSDEGFLEVLEVEFLTQPAATCVEPGEAAVFTAEAVSTAPFMVGYAWEKDGVLLSDEPGHLAGTQTDTLTVMNASELDEGIYTAVAYSLPSPICLLDSDAAVLGVGDCPVPCAAPGDMDGDGDRDLADLRQFTLCFSADVTVRSECVCANVDVSDSVVDIGDWELLEGLLDGPH